MTEHISTVIVAAVVWSVLTRIVTHIQTTVPGWLTMAVMCLTVAGVALTVLALGTLILFCLQLYWTVKDERERHASDLAQQKWEMDAFEAWERNNG